MRKAVHDPGPDWVPQGTALLPTIQDHVQYRLFPRTTGTGHVEDLQICWDVGGTRVVVTAGGEEDEDSRSRCSPLEGEESDSSPSGGEQPGEPRVLAVHSALSSKLADVLPVVFPELGEAEQDCFCLVHPEGLKIVTASGDSYGPVTFGWPGEEGETSVRGVAIRDVFAVDCGLLVVLESRPTGTRGLQR